MRATDVFEENVIEVKAYRNSQFGNKKKIDVVYRLHNERRIVLRKCRLGVQVVAESNPGNRILFYDTERVECECKSLFNGERIG